MYAGNSGERNIYSQSQQDALKVIFCRSSSEKCKTWLLPGVLSLLMKNQFIIPYAGEDD